MNNSDKIKAIQHKVGLKIDGIVGLKTWIGIYDLLFDSLPINTNEDALIKAIQQKLQLKVTGKPNAKTLDLAYEAIFGKPVEINAKEKYSYVATPTTTVATTETADSFNDIILKQMTKEVVPFAKELIHIAADEGICLRIMNKVREKNSQAQEKRQIAKHIFMDAQSSVSVRNFGLAFDIGIFEENTTGELIFKDRSPLYEKVAQLGASIGLTCAKNNKNSTQVPHFELRPAWAVQMKESEMIQELYRRKKENINLLAFI